MGRVWKILQHLFLSLQLADLRQLALLLHRWEFEANNFNFVFSINNREVIVNSEFRSRIWEKVIIFFLFSCFSLRKLENLRKWNWTSDQNKANIRVVRHVLGPALVMLECSRTLAFWDSLTSDYFQETKMYTTHSHAQNIIYTICCVVYLLRNRWANI